MIDNQVSGIELQSEHHRQPTVMLLSAITQTHVIVHTSVHDNNFQSKLIAQSGVGVN